jgi:hypothetical protein
MFLLISKRSFVTTSNRPAGMGSGRQAVSSPGWSEGRAKRLPPKPRPFSYAVASCRLSGTGRAQDRRWLSKFGVQTSPGFDATVRIKSVTRIMESVQQTCAMCCFQSLQMFHPLELRWLSLHDLIVWPRPHFREILLKRARTGKHTIDGEGGGYESGRFCFAAQALGVSSATRWMERLLRPGSR